MTAPAVVALTTMAVLVAVAVWWIYMTMEDEIRQWRRRRAKAKRPTLNPWVDVTPLYVKPSGDGLRMKIRYLDGSESEHHITRVEMRNPHVPESTEEAR